MAGRKIVTTAETTQTKLPHYIPILAIPANALILSDNLLKCYARDERDDKRERHNNAYHALLL